MKKKTKLFFGLYLAVLLAIPIGRMVVRQTQFLLDQVIQPGEQPKLQLWFVLALTACVAMPWIVNRWEDQEEEGQEEINDYTD